MEVQYMQNLQTSEDFTEISFSGMAFLDQHSQTLGFHKSTTLFYERKGQAKGMAIGIGPRFILLCILL